MEHVSSDKILLDNNLNFNGHKFLSVGIFYSSPINIYIFRVFICFIPSIGRPGGLCDWVFFLGPCLVFPLTMWLVCRGPGSFLGSWRCSLVYGGAMRGGIFGPMPGFSPCPSGVWDAGAQGPEVPLDTPIPFDAMDQIW